MYVPYPYAVTPAAASVYPLCVYSSYSVSLSVVPLLQLRTASAYPLFLFAPATASVYPLFLFAPATASVYQSSSFFLIQLQVQPIAYVVPYSTPSSTYAYLPKAASPPSLAFGPIRLSNLLIPRAQIGQRSSDWPCQQQCW